MERGRLGIGDLVGGSVAIINSVTAGSIILVTLWLIVLLMSRVDVVVMNMQYV
jgi:hypothetical protein